MEHSKNRHNERKKNVVNMSFKPLKSEWIKNVLKQTSQQVLSNSNASIPYLSYNITIKLVAERLTKQVYKNIKVSLIFGPKYKFNGSIVLFAGLQFFIISREISSFSQ